jgi:hypothetical protein
VRAGVTVINDGARSAYHGTIHSVFYSLEQMKKMGEIGDLVIIVARANVFVELLEIS